MTGFRCCKWPVFYWPIYNLCSIHTVLWENFHTNNIHCEVDHPGMKSQDLQVCCQCCFWMAKRTQLRCEFKHFTAFSETDICQLRGTNKKRHRHVGSRERLDLRAAPILGNARGFRGPGARSLQPLRHRQHSFNGKPKPSWMWRWKQILLVGKNLGLQLRRKRVVHWTTLVLLHFNGALYIGSRNLPLLIGSRQFFATLGGSGSHRSLVAQLLELCFCWSRSSAEEPGRPGSQSWNRPAKDLPNLPSGATSRLSTLSLLSGLCFRPWSSLPLDGQMHWEKKSLCLLHLSDCGLRIAWLYHAQRPFPACRLISTANKRRTKSDVQKNDRLDVVPW